MLLLVISNKTKIKLIRIIFELIATEPTTSDIGKIEIKNRSSIYLSLLSLKT